jgi:hypothetical protein
MTHITEYVCPCGCMRIVYTWESEGMDKLLDVDLARGMTQKYDADGDLIQVPREACESGKAEGEKMIQLRKKWLI